MKKTIWPIYAFCFRDTRIRLRWDRSIEKIAGFLFEEISPESGINERGKFESDRRRDEYNYAILKRDWLELYDPVQIWVIS